MMTLRTTLTLLMLTLLACAPEEIPPVPDGPPMGERDAVAVLATAASTFDVGALTTVSLDDGTAADVATIHPDAWVRAEGDAVWLMSRLQVDTVRQYAPGQWAEPAWEASTGLQSNPQDVALCGGRLFVSRYELDALLVLDPSTGAEIGTVDLSAWSDEDGIPEVASLEVLDGRLFAALQRLDRLNGWTDAPGGRLVEVDCESLVGVEAWDAGPNPILARLPDALAVVGAGGVRVFDGEVVGEPVLADVDGAQVLDLAVGGDGRGVLLVREGTTHTVACVDVHDWSTSTVRVLANYVSDVAVNDRGEAWIAVRQSWDDPEVTGGVMVVDLDGCEDLTADGWIATTFPPFAVTFY